MEMKRKIQKWSEREVRAIAKALRIPFAIDRQRAREILSSKRFIREPRELTRNGETKFPFARIWRAPKSTTLRAA